MTINDLLDSESFFTFLVIVIGICMFFYLFKIYANVTTQKQTNKGIPDDEEYLSIEDNAKIINKRVLPHPLNRSVTVYMVVFGISNENRIALEIKDPNTYNAMVEGDCGLLTYQEKKFISFESNNKKSV